MARFLVSTLHFVDNVITEQGQQQEEVKVCGVEVASKGSIKAVVGVWICIVFVW
jgi:hypothetical protein